MCNKCDGTKELAITVTLIKKLIAYEESAKIQLVKVCGYTQENEHYFCLVQKSGIEEQKWSY